jgi:hypothetical protein
VKSRPSEASAHASKEAAAISVLDADPIPPPRPRRVRRRRRSVRRRLFDGILPFAALVGLTAFAVGMVQIVEIGAAKQSRRLGKHKPPAPAARSSFDYDLARANDLPKKGRHADARSRIPRIQNQVAYQRSLQLEEQQDLSLAFGPPKAAETSDVMDWSFFDHGTEDPRFAPRTRAARPSSARQ